MCHKTLYTSISTSTSFESRSCWFVNTTGSDHEMIDKYNFAEDAADEVIEDATEEVAEGDCCCCCSSNESRRMYPTT